MIKRIMCITIVPMVGFEVILCDYSILGKECLPEVLFLYIGGNYEIWVLFEIKDNIGVIGVY